MAALGGVVSVTVSAVNPTRVAAVDSKGNFYRSDDVGNSWQTR